MAADWRRIMAVLANPDAARVLAQVILDTPVDAALAEFAPAKQQKLRATLTDAGILGADGAFLPEVFRQALAQESAPRETGIARFRDGKRIRNYPAILELRAELLAWVADDAFTPGVQLSEREVNEALVTYHDDVAVLRRYLVDLGLLQRNRDGSRYVRPISQA